jgi:cyclopropane-fatty-acyl-phospholipid synthase
MGISTLVEDILGGDIPIGVRAYDGSTGGPADPPATLVVRSPDALRRIMTAPGELGFGRAYVSGDLEIEGDIFAALAVRDHLSGDRLERRHWVALVRLLGVTGIRWVRPPHEEARLHGRLHSKARDAAAVAHHYDVSNAFYRIVLGPSLTYSCAVWESPDAGLDAAQDAKHELIARKLALEPGMRLLDVGCGWGSLLLHAARHHGVCGVGVTLSRRQAELASKRVAEAGLTDRLEVRVQDYRDVNDGPYDAISSIGMFEHVGLSQLRVYFDRLFALLAPGGRLGGVDVATQRVRGPTHGESPRALRAHVAGVGREPRGQLGRGGRGGRCAEGAGLAVVHGRFGTQLRDERQSDPPGARGETRRCTQWVPAARQIRVVGPNCQSGSTAARLSSSS